VAALLNTIEHLAVTTGSAVALAGHFSKGNHAGKVSIDRNTGSGVFARDPDSLLIFTAHEEDNAFTVESLLRNFPPVKPFVVKWKWPAFHREENLDPANLKTSAGRPSSYEPEQLLQCLGDSRLTSKQWIEVCLEEEGISQARFYCLKKRLETAGKVQQSKVDGKWEQIRKNSRNANNEKGQ
jgi:hypothetical protein